MILNTNLLILLCGALVIISGFSLEAFMNSWGQYKLSSLPNHHLTNSQLLQDDDGDGEEVGYDFDMVPPGIAQ